MQIANPDLFENATAVPVTAKPTRIQEHVAESVVIVVASKGQTQRAVRFVRLDDAEHGRLRETTKALVGAAGDKSDASMYVAIWTVLNKPSGKYGNRSGKFSTLGDMLYGISEKLAAPHRYVRGRCGKDLSVEQINAFNLICSDIGVELFDIPTKELK